MIAGMQATTEFLKLKYSSSDCFDLNIDTAFTKFFNNKNHR
jgi:hypothetical protein